MSHRLSLLRPSLLVFAALAACGQPDPVAENVNGEALPPPPVVRSSNPTGAPPPDNAAVETRPADGAAPEASARIPPFLHGRWALAPADCTSTRGDAKGLLVVGPNGLQFYESRAVPVRNTAVTKDSFSADFAFTGEGMEWTRFETLQIENGSLVRTESNPMASYTYAKCA